MKFTVAVSVAVAVAIAVTVPVARAVRDLVPVAVAMFMALEVSGWDGILQGHGWSRVTL